MAFGNRKGSERVAKRKKEILEKAVREEEQARLIQRACSCFGDRVKGVLYRTRVELAGGLGLSQEMLSAAVRAIGLLYMGAENMSMQAFPSISIFKTVLCVTCMSGGQETQFGGGRTRVFSHST